jgi:uncharacterized damage-inducible protein DinB
MPQETFFGYQDIGEKGFIKWCLNYTMDAVIDCFLSIPASHSFTRLFGELNAPAWIFGHIALNEEGLIRGFAQGIRERMCPYPARLFDGWAVPTEEEFHEAEVRPEALAEYWRAVRAETLDYVDALSEADLAKEPVRSILPHDDANRHNPIREFFVMAIQHQNYHWGQLQTIAKLIETGVGK